MFSSRAKKSILIFSLFALSALGDRPALGAKNFQKCYSIDENSMANLERSNLVLCVSSDDLKKYPKSIVTITIEEIQTERAPASAVVQDLYAANVHTKLVAKRHYVRIAEGEYGRKGLGYKAGLRFNELDRTVFVGFLDAVGKTYFYKPLVSPMLQKQQLKSFGAQR